jgi:hypothetical protein
MGARLKVRQASGVRPGTRPDGYGIDIVSDREGEAFELNLGEEALDFQVLDTRPGDRHLLLMVRREDRFPRKFLCGFDERHWFVAGVALEATNVEAAKNALKPDLVLAAQVRRRVKKKNRHRRKNAGFVRQGEWFFLPAFDLVVDDWLVMKNEPISRGRGRAHRVDQVYRRGGQTVYVGPGYPNGLTQAGYNKLLREQPNLKKAGWRTMRRDPEAYGRGRVRHPDHKTIRLRNWHRILPNAEVASRQLAFLD